VYVEIVRNIPLPVLLFFTVLVLPQFGLDLDFFPLAVGSLVIYYAGFFCEIVRSGFNGVAIGQIEAARAIGLSRSRMLAGIVLPQALRSIVPPLIGIFIQIVRSSAVAGAFGVAELFAKMNFLITRHADQVILILILTSVFYLVITIPSGLLLGRLERKAAFSR
jgi:glutamate transport system permease protein